MSWTSVIGRPPSIAQWQETRILWSTLRTWTSWQFNQLVVFGLQRVQKILHGPREPFHFFGAGDTSAERLDMNIDARTGIGGATNVFLQFGGAAMRFAQARAFVHFQVQFNKQQTLELMGR